MRRFRATVAYDGRGYLGFQRQRPEQLTVQGEIEKALGRIAKRPTAILAAGRTDSGVHGRGQVIAFDFAWRHGLDKLLLALNAHLPDDIAVTSVDVVAADFHPRFDARRRTYEYYIEECADWVRRPLTRHYHWQLFELLDLEKMNGAAAHLLGERDFATFGQPPQGHNTVREVFRAEWRREKQLLIFTIQANAFLYRMVRCIVGTLKLVGDGSWTIQDFVAALEARDRQQVSAMAPAHGLYLLSVSY